MKMIWAVVYVSFLVFALTFPSRAFSDEVPKDHQHKTPHSGIMREADEIHAEFLIDKNGHPKLYLYDKAMKPSVRKHHQVRLMIKGHDESEHSRNLKPSGNPEQRSVYQGKPIKGMSNWELAVVSLKIKGHWVHIRFSHH